jgi:hypothetical protein
MDHEQKNSSIPWYREGLSFKCTGCGNCCTGAPGYVWVTPDEMSQIANHLKMPLNAFTRRYVRKVGSRYSLIEIRTLQPAVFRCVFLEERKCSIYEVRPKQCRTFPWWKENLSSPEAWQRASQECEGIHVQPSTEIPVVAFEQVQEQLKLHENEEGPLP